ncbi:hypothetical protein EXS73_01055 [Candidatus Pacearchaeota archaeon]|nr:hypothetical protein [Candidatus Pacearchaeota archaeon]
MRGALPQDELGKWTIGLVLLCLVAVALVTQYNSGVFSFFQQIPTNLTSYDTGDGYAYVRYNPATLQVEYRQTDTWVRFGDESRSFTLGKVDVVPGEVKETFRRYWFGGVRGSNTFYFLQGELSLVNAPAYVSSEVSDVSLFPWPKQVYVCATPCIKRGDLTGAYLLPGGISPGVFILRSNNAIEFVRNTGSTFTLLQKELEEAKKVMLAYRDGYLDIPLSYGGKAYCIQYRVSGKEGHLVIDVARPVEDTTVCAGQ